MQAIEGLLTVIDLLRAIGINYRRFIWLREIRGGEFEPVRRIGGAMLFPPETVAILKKINSETPARRPGGPNDRRRKGNRNG